MSVDDRQLGTISIREKPSKDGYLHGYEALGRYTFDAKEGRRSFGLSLSASGTVVMANLNYLSVSYERHLRLPSSGWLAFDSPSAILALGNAREDMRIWDVSSVTAPVKIDYTISDGEAHWAMESRADRSFVAWSTAADLPAPQAAGLVTNQNLHSEEGAEMIIICPSEYSEAASRLADFHRSGPEALSVKVVDPLKIYNEFSSGASDVSGLRKYLKMVYDRGESGSGPALKYVVLMARTTLDNRRISPSPPSYPTLPAWMPSSTVASLSDNDGFCTDDFTAMLGDGSGADMGRDKLSVAVGRIPVTGADEASAIVDKILQYAAEHAKRHGNSVSSS